METDAIKGANKNSRVLGARKQPSNSGFAKVLSDQQSTKGPERQLDGTSRGETLDFDPAHGNSEKVPLGTISETMSTVSHLLVGHPQYGDHCWGIVHSEQNRCKPYTKIQPGTAIFIDPESLEIAWGEEIDPAQPTHSEARKPLAERHDVLAGPRKDEVSVRSETMPGGVAPEMEPAEKKGHPVFLGTITESTPTVSHILVDHPQYGRDAWQIIHSQVNREKPYTSIQAGTAVYLDTETGEICWGQGDTNVESMASARGATLDQKSQSAQVQGHEPFSTQLAKAVEPYIGRPYEEVDCYELVVQGLVSLGVRYHGAGGLLERLKGMALQEGLPRNAYLNGEGLVEASGTKIYSKSFVGIRNAQAQAREVIRELEGLLRKGFIISFSTHTKGHTGIVSERNGEWTFINSGRMDNHLVMGTQARLVGEERLSEEIKDWFALAAQRRESLKITVGRLDENKLMTFRDDQFSGTKELKT